MHVRAFFLLLLMGCHAAGAPRPAGDVPVTPARRAESRSLPSIFQAWSPAENAGDEDPLVIMARHDLVWHSPGMFGLRWGGGYEGLATGFVPESLATGAEKRRKLMALNPNIILIAEVRFRDAWKGYLPEGHRWWKRDASGKVVPGWEEGGFILMDFADPEFRRHVAAQCAAVAKSGVFDGILLDWWDDDDDRLALVREIRAAVGPDALIMANANTRKTPRTAPFINGYFMECTANSTPGDWLEIADTLLWAETNLVAPRVNCVETWFRESRKDFALMRSTTTLVLTMSDGYALFSDPNPLPTPDHLHDWYPFWDRSLGRPRGKGGKGPDGTWQREFENGTVVYNPMGNPPAEVSFGDKRRSVGLGTNATRFTLPGGDGDLYLSR